MNILITAANSAAAWELKNKLVADNITMGDYMELPEFMLQLGKLIILPSPASVSYAHQMLAICLDRGIIAVYPLREEEMQQLQPSVQLFKEYNIDILRV